MADGEGSVSQMAKSSFGWQNYLSGRYRPPKFTSVKSTLWDILVTWISIHRQERSCRSTKNYVSIPSHTSRNERCRICIMEPIWNKLKRYFVLIIVLNCRSKKQTIHYVLNYNKNETAKNVRKKDKIPDFFLYLHSKWGLTILFSFNYY